jgi:hypothetical protein
MVVASTEQVPGAPMTTIEELGVAAQQIAHRRTHGDRLAPDDKVYVVAHQAVGEARQNSLTTNGSKPDQKPLPVLIIKEDVAAIRTPRCEVVRLASHELSRAAGHETSV